MFLERIREKKKTISFSQCTVQKLNCTTCPEAQIANAPDHNFVIRRKLAADGIFSHMCCERQQANIIGEEMFSLD
jgi:hypothetical protein